MGPVPRGGRGALEEPIGRRIGRLQPAVARAGDPNGAEGLAGAAALGPRSPSRTAPGGKEVPHPWMSEPRTA